MMAMQVSAQAFADLHEEDDSDDGDGTEDGQSSLVDGKKNKLRDESNPLPTCIVCRLNRQVSTHSSNDVLGFLCWAQLSSAFIPSETNILHVDESRIDQSPTCLVPVLTFCSHAMHRDCFDQFWSGELAKNQSLYLSGTLIVNTS